MAVHHIACQQVYLPNQVGSANHGYGPKQTLLGFQ